LLLTEQENQNIRKRYIEWWLSYKEVKDMLYNKLDNFIKPIKQKYEQIDDSFVTELLHKNKQKVKTIADAKIQDVYKKVGFRL